MVSKVRVSCRVHADGRWVCCQKTKKEERLEKEEGRSGGACKKWMSEGNEGGEMENKRGHWRQIKDTQLND